MRKVSTLIPLFIALLCTGSVFAQSDIFVKIIDGSGALIKGASTDKTHPDEIMAVSYGQDNTGCPITAGGGGTGACNANLGNFIFNMTGDKSLPLLNQALFTNNVLHSVDIVFRKATAGGATQSIEYYKVHLETVSITHITNSYDNAGSLLAQVTLSAAKAGWTYTGQKASGAPDTPVKWGWDITRRAPWTSF
jgi:type VI secretion system Hcp family effector